MQVNEDSKGCYNVNCKSGYNTYGRDAFKIVTGATYTSSFETVTCGTVACNDGYTQVSSSAQCSSGVDYNGKIWCCPEGNLIEKEEYFTVIAKVDSSCANYSISLALTDGNGKYYSSGTSVNGITATTTAIPGKGEIGLCMDTNYGSDSMMSAFRIYINSEGGSSNCYSDTPSGSYSSCYKTDRVLGIGDGGGCSFVNYTFSAGHTYIIKGVGCHKI